MREPLSWVASYTALWMRMMKIKFTGGEAESGLGHGIRRVGRDLIAQAEALLCVLEHLGCQVDYWHMDHYTTEDGFKALAKSLRLEVRDPLVDFNHRWNGTNPAIKLNPSHWSNDLREELLTFWDACPHLQDGYRRATERMSEICEEPCHGTKSS